MAVMPQAAPANRQGKAPSTYDLAASQLLSSFPSTPTASALSKALRQSDSSISSGPDAAGAKALRSAMGSGLKRSRLHRASHYSTDVDAKPMAKHASSKRRNGLQSSNRAYAEDHGVEDAANALLLLARAAESQQAVLPLLQGISPELLSHLAATVAAAATGLLANTPLPIEDLIAAANQLAQYYYSQQAILDAQSAGVHASSAQTNPAHTIEELAAATRKWAQYFHGQQAGLGVHSTGVLASSAQSTPKALHSSPPTSGSFAQHAETSWPATPNSTTPFAAFASTRTPSQGCASELEDAGADADDNTTAFASIWAQQNTLQAQLPAIKVKSTAQQPPLASAALAAATAVAGAAEDDFDAFGAMQSPQAQEMGPVTPPPAKLSARRRKLRAVRAASDQSVFSREVADYVGEEAKVHMRAHWAAAGRVAVTCGPAGSAGISGIFTLNSAGKPVIWAPMDTAAAARLSRVVAAGASLRAAPAGYEEIEPKVFEERARKCRSRNWQLSIAVPGFSCGMVSSSRQKQPFVIKLGHFTRICGIPTAKQ